MSMNIGFNDISKKKTVLVLKLSDGYLLVYCHHFLNESDFTAVDYVIYVPTSFQFPCPNQRYLIVSLHLIF